LEVCVLENEHSYSFGAWLKRQRSGKGFTQKELATRAFCSPETIKKIEADQRRPSPALAESLAAALDWPAERLQVFVECARGQRPVDQLWRESPAGKSAEPSPFSLPDQASALPLFETPLIGREGELETLRQLVAEAWLVTIVGLGGTGKTRLAAAAAAAQQQSGQAIVYVSLTNISQEDNLAAAILEAFGLRLASGTDPVTQLLAYLRHKKLLLVLDNFEHLLDGASLLLQLHQAAPAVSILVTSRVRLNLPAEQLLPLRGLAYPSDRAEFLDLANTGQAASYPAAELFLIRARRLIPAYTPNDDEALLRLCQISDGLPLALELAAAWIDSLTLPELVRELEKSLDLLTQKQADESDRQHSVRAVFDATWQLLRPAEQLAFTRLTVFSGGFTREAALAVADTWFALLADLVGRHLVQLDRKNGRYGLHELLRQYGQEKLAAAASMEQTVRRQHARFFCRYLIDTDANLRSAKQKKALTRIRIERANIWQAWHWAVDHPAELDLLPIVLALGNACWLGNWVEDGFTLFPRSAHKLAPFREQAHVLPTLLCLSIWRSQFALWLGRLTEAPLIDAQLVAADLAPSPATRPVLALYHWVAAEIFLDTGVRDTARRHAQQALGLYESMDDVWGQANSLNRLGTICWNVGAYAESRAYFEESLALQRQLGNKWGLAAALDRLGLLLMHQGELDTSGHYLAQAVDYYDELGDRVGYADASENLGSLWLEEGRFAEAHGQYRLVAAIYDELGIRHIGYTVLKALTAYASVHAGAYERADREAKAAQNLSQELGHKRSEGLALLALGMTDLALSKDAAASVHLQRGTDYLRDINQLEELAQGLGALALSAFRQGQRETAKTLVFTSLELAGGIRGLSASPSFPLAVWALILASDGDNDQAEAVYRLALAEPFAAASHWFADMFGDIFPDVQLPGILPLKERWAAIEKLFQTFQ
jgi:predicted ATPase/tetratricopeptide (TPR) repeat protein/DNA-binding XRE family transcriptional regulator